MTCVYELSPLDGMACIELSPLLKFKIIPFIVFFILVTYIIGLPLTASC